MTMMRTSSTRNRNSIQKAECHDDVDDNDDDDVDVDADGNDDYVVT